MHNIIKVGDKNTDASIPVKDEGDLAKVKSPPPVPPKENSGCFIPRTDDHLQGIETVKILGIEVMLHST